MVLSGYVDSAGAAKNDAGAGTGAFYQLRDLSLTYDLLVPDETGRSQLGVAASGGFEYNSVQNLYSVINTSDTTQSLNLGTSNTLSVIHNFVPTTHINNYGSDSFSTGELKNVVAGAYTGAVDLQEVSFMKGGVKFPLDYEIDTKTQAEENRPMSLLKKEFINAIKPINLYNHSLMSLQTDSGLGASVGPTSGVFVNENTLPDTDPIFGIGVNLDPVSRVGVNYKNTPYAVRIRSDLDGNSPNSIYTYTLSKNTLRYSPAGIMVAN